MTVRFDEALRRYLEVLRAGIGELASAGQLVVVRDLYGRLRLAMEHDIVIPDALEQHLKDAAGRYFGGDALVREHMIAPDSLFAAPEAIRVCESHDVRLLERVIVGAEWSRPPLRNEDPKPPRATVYGIKGGVGRSTALCAWARHLALTGNRVLVIDLDLESPGVSTLLLPDDLVAESGIVDWLVEDAVENADEALARSMISKSPLASGTTGEIAVVGCGNLASGTYLDKLSRAYLDVPQVGHDTPMVETFAMRLARLVDELERITDPTVVLIDSRAGLHDLAGIAVTRLQAMTFLFAVGSRQTWEGYRTLLRAWSNHPKIALEVRGRIKVVAAQVPETGVEAYLEQFKQDAYDVFEVVYEEASADRPEAFNFDIEAQDAPHYPLRIDWSRRMQDWDPLTTEVTDEHVRAALGSFLDGATQLTMAADSEGSDGASE